MMKVLKLGDPRLRKRAVAVNDIGSRSFCFNLDALKEALEHYGGMGIAAPQLGLDQRILLIHSRPNKRYPNAPASQLMIMVNPKILSTSDDKELAWEGCLSVPDQRAQVWRFSTIDISYEDLAGNVREEKFEGFLARIFQHEYDHLQGVLFVDRVEDKSKIVSEQEYLHIMDMG